MKTCGGVSCVIIVIVETHGGVLVGFLNDEIWNRAKSVVKQNGMGDNWLEIIDYYYHTNGCHVQIYALLGDTAYRILRITDSEEVLLIDRNNNLFVKAYDEVLESRKQFFFSEGTLEETDMDLPNGQSVYGASKVKIYI